MKPNNPFLISGYYSPEFFCDRIQETDSLADALLNGRNVTLIAPRRIGKTGLIMNLFYHLREQRPDVVTLYMDIFPTHSLSDFVRLFANTVLGRLDSAPKKALNRVSKFIKSCRPVFTFDEFSGMPKVSIDLAPSDEEVTLKELFDYLHSADKRFYIAIDEFQQIEEYPEKGVEALLRSFIQYVPNVNFIFSGSKQHVMQEMFLSAKRPFYQSTQTILIGSIEKRVYYEFASSFFKKQGRELPENVFNTIYERFNGYTWYIQDILNHLYGYAAAIDDNLLDYAISEIVSDSSYSYESLLSTYPTGSVTLLKAIATEGCVKEITSGDFISKHNLKAASSVKSSLNKLLKNELVYKKPEGYIVYDRFMNEWLRNQSF